MIKLSVVVCTYNRADILPGCLDSLVKQTARDSDYEVIVVDNNSSDRTGEIVRDYINAGHGNIKYVMEPQQGLSHARNRGYKEARGDYVAYIDDDARAMPDWVENILGFIARHSSVAAFGGPYKGFSLVPPPKWYKESYGTCSLGGEERPIAQDEWISGTNMVYKKSLLADMNGFHVEVGMKGDTISYGEETNFILRIRRDYPIYYVPDVVVEHLVADYKLHLKWMLHSYFRHGYSALDVFQLHDRSILRQLFYTAFQLTKGVIHFIFSKEHYLKARVLDSFGEFVSSIGLTARMLKK